VKSSMAFASVLVLGFAAAATAQAPAGPPKPGPEHKKLDYFVGKWTMEGDAKTSPFGPAGKITGTDNCEWFAGGFHVVCRTDGKGPAGDMKAIGLLGYNGEDKAYTYYGIDNMGMGSGSKGTLAGDTWNWSGEEKMGGKVVKSKYTIKQLSPSSYTLKFEMSMDGGKTWTAPMEGKQTRATK